MAKRTSSTNSDEMTERLIPLHDDPGKVYDALAAKDGVNIGKLAAQPLRIAANVERPTSTSTQQAKHARKVTVREVHSRLTHDSSSGFRQA